MKVRLTRWYNAVLTALLTMLGYGCSMEEPMDMYGTLVLMYGVPATTYMIEGTVTDEAGKPVRDISVTVKQKFKVSEGDNYMTVDSVGSGADGKFAVRDYMDGVEDKTPPNPERVIIFTDIDGEANDGQFLPDTLKLKDQQLTKTVEGEGYYDLGTYNIGNIKLKKK